MWAAVLSGVGMELSDRYTFFVSLIMVLGLSWTVWRPVFKSRPKCWFDGKTQAEDWYHSIKLSVATLLTLSPFTMMFL